MPVAYDKSIYPQKDGSFLLVVKEDDNEMRIPRATLEEAQATSDVLPRDYGEPFWWDDIWRLVLNRKVLNASA